MTIRRFGLAVLAAAVALIGSASVAQAAQAKPAKGNKGAAAAGKVSKIDATAKTFVVSSKKKGDFTVSFSDTTTFKKAPAAEGATAASATFGDLKDGMRVMVKGKTEGTKVTATEVMIGGGAKKKKVK
jgi:hypothetical protein